MAGNLWQAACIGLGAPAALAEQVPQLLGFDWVRAAFQQRSEGGRLVCSLHFHGVDSDDEMTLAEMLEVLRETPLPEGLAPLAQQLLVARQQALAWERVADVRGIVFRGAEAVDPLIDIVGSLLCWDALGRPAVTTEAPLEYGSGRPGVERLLGGILKRRHPSTIERTTPTGAALIGRTWQPILIRCRPEREIWVEGAFSRQQLAPQMVARLYPQREPAPLPLA